MLKKECGGGSPAKEIPAVGVLAILLEFRRVDPEQPDTGSADTAGPLALAIHNQRITVRYACRAGYIGMGDRVYLVPGGAGRAGVHGASGAATR